MGFPTTKKDEVESLIQRLFRKIRQGFEEIMLYETFLMEDATAAIVAYGCTARSAKSAVLMLRKEGMKVGLLKLSTLWPFPRVAVESLPEQVQDLVVPEMNMGQLYREVVRVGRGRFRVRKVSRIDGELITPQEIIYGLKRRERK
jgi:2-oxoglutarate ferredoxin oxidoreductase subunit alpha